eukprot:1145380-Pelagomonas_calceolata.AAC.5
MLLPPTVLTAANGNTLRMAWVLQSVPESSNYKPGRSAKPLIVDKCYINQHSGQKVNHCQPL